MAENDEITGAGSETPTAPTTPANGGDEATAVDYAPAEVPRDTVMPMFYERPQPLTPERHQGKSLIQGVDRKLIEKVRKTNSLPINVLEFGLAMRNYPIVFTQSDPPLPVAVLGLRNEENLFVNDEGGWVPDAYVPAYVRRHPFIFMSGPDQKQFVLCIDEASELLAAGDERPLFVDGKPSELVDNALKFCTAFQQQHEVSRAFGEALAKHNLLAPNRAEVALKSGERLRLGGFRVVEEARLNTLDNETFLDWRKKGWLPAIYAHMFSAGNWNALATRLNQRS